MKVLLYCLLNLCYGNIANNIFQWSNNRYWTWTHFHWSFIHHKDDPIFVYLWFTNLSRTTKDISSKCSLTFEVYSFSMKLLLNATCISSCWNTFFANLQRLYLFVHSYTYESGSILTLFSILVVVLHEGRTHSTHPHIMIVYSIKHNRMIYLIKHVFKISKYTQLALYQSMTKEIAYCKLLIIL